jgi:Phosphotransferase enzyme family
VGATDDPPSPQAPSRDDAARMERALRSRANTWRSVRAHGAETNRRWIVALDGGESAFVKIAATDEGADWLRNERTVYRALNGARFLPRLIGWHDDGERPALAIENLAEADWPPPWTPARIDSVRASLAEVARTPPPAALPSASQSQFDLNGWPEITADPGPFLDLGMCSAAWLERALPALYEAARRADLGGDSLLHMDVRSDNLCVIGDRAILIDWNWACRGNAAFDLAAWLPSLHAEGGPAPETIMPEAGAFAALLAGYFCAHAARPPIPLAPHVRPLQLAQARIALPWAARALGLPPPVETAG